MLKTLFCILISIGICQPAWSTPHRAMRLGGSYNIFNHLSSANKITFTDRPALGLVSVYEFLLTENFTLGIQLGYRHYLSIQEGTRFSQLGYGLLMKHGIPAVSFSENSHLYLEYGLLMNIHSASMYAHSATSHDTKLTLGYEWDLPLGYFFDYSYHISHLAYLNEPVYNLGYSEFSAGVRWKW